MDAVSLDATHSFIAGKCGLVPVVTEYYGNTEVYAKGSLPYKKILPLALRESDLFLIFYILNTETEMMKISFSNYLQTPQSEFISTVSTVSFLTRPGNKSVPAEGSTHPEADGKIKS